MRSDYDSTDVLQLIDALASQVAGVFGASQPINIVGIRTRGETLAGRLTHALRARGFDQIGRGVLDITLYRDDLSEIGPRPMVRPTVLTIDIDRRPMILVDDVLFTGRTVRAALHALSDFGRPSVVRLLTLVDRGGRELPIRADFCALQLGELSHDLKVKVQFKENDERDAITIEPRAKL